MKINYYAIKDKVADEFGFLYPAKNDGVAIRNFDMQLQNVVKKTDFELWCVSSFDSESGQLDLSFDSYKVAINEEVDDVDNEN